MKRYLLYILLVIGATACVKDDVVERSDDFSIRFRVSQNNVMRSIDHTNTSLNGFSVWATHVDAIPFYMEEAQVEKLANGEWLPTEPYQWPASGSLDFYAVAGINADACEGNYLVTFDQTEKTLTIDFIATKDISKLSDVIYATAMDKTKEDGTVSLFFRHALSRVAFQVRNIDNNPANKYTIYGLKLCNVHARTQLTFPTATTVADDEKIRCGCFTKTSWRDWQLFSNEQGVAVPNDGVAVSLNNEPGKYLYHPIMRNQPVWDPAGDPQNTNHGGYLLLDCSVTCNGVTIWPLDGSVHGELAIPIDNNSEYGRSYLYTIVFGQAHGGSAYTVPGENGGESILEGLCFDVTMTSVSMDSENLDLVK